MPDVAHGTEWNQTGLRRMSNGDYFRLSVEAYGNRTRLQIGNEKGDMIEWRWEMILPMFEVTSLALDLNYALIHATQHADAKNAQDLDRMMQMQKQVDDMRNPPPVDPEPDVPLLEAPAPEAAPIEEG